MSKPTTRKWGVLQDTMDKAFSSFGNSSILLGIGTFTLIIGVPNLFDGDPVFGAALLSITSVTWTLALIYSVRAIYFVNLGQLNHQINQSPPLGSLPSPTQLTNTAPHYSQNHSMETWPIGWTQEMKNAYNIAQQNNPGAQKESPEQWAKKFYK